MLKGEFSNFYNERWHLKTETKTLENEMWRGQIF